MIKYRLELLFFLVLILSNASCGYSGNELQEKQESLVWSIQSKISEEYIGVFSPPEARQIYILANETCVFIPRKTLVYYWPLDREYKPDWGSMKENVKGTLEISINNQNLSINFEKFLIQSKANNGSYEDNLFLGDSAEKVYQEYESRLDQYLSSIEEYDKQLELYWNAISEKPYSTSIQTLIEPEAFSELVFPIKEGFPINLPSGTYKMRLRGVDGTIIPNSERTIISIVPRRVDVGYLVIPESKWTTPETSYDPNSIIYTTANEKRLFFQPYIIEEYNYLEYVRLTDPQDTIVSKNEWVWIPKEKMEKVKLQVVNNNLSLPLIPIIPYSVNQIPGSALGYEIIPVPSTDTDSSDFEAMAVSIPADTNKFELKLIQTDGTVLKNSERKIIQVSNGLPSALYAVVFIPLLVYLGIRLKKYKRKKYSKTVLSEINITNN